MIRWLRITLILLGMTHAFTQTRAEVFPLDMGRLGHQAGTLEVALDQAFTRLLVTIPTGDKQEYLVNFPETAVYFIRVRHQQKVVWQEAVLALQDPLPKDRMPRLDWNAVQGAQRYRLWICRNQFRARWLETPEQAANLHRIGAPWLVRLRAIQATGSLLPLPMLNFQWVGTGVQASRPREPEILLNPVAKDDDQVVYEPEDKDLLAGSEESPMDAFIARVTPPNLPPLLRRHEIYGWLRYLNEQFEIDKKDRFESDPSVGLGTGAAGQYFLAPNLSITGTIDTHSTKTDYEVGGSQTPEIEQKRIRIHVAIGLDLLNTNLRTTDWSLNLGPAIGMIQIPLQENEQKFTDYGLKLDSHHYPTRTSLSFLLLKSGSREIDARWIAPWTMWSIHPFLGLYSYESRQSAGAVTGLFHEKGLRLGLGRDF